MIPRGVDPRVFADYLTTLGIASRVDDRPEGWVVWVHNEDRLAQARQELEQFLRDPAHPRYQAARQGAATVRRESARLDRQYRKNFRDMSGTWDGINARRRPLTVALVAISVAVFLLAGGHNGKLWSLLSFSSFVVDEHHRVHTRGLTDILSGEVWRLVTPIFLHYDTMHLVFNMWALLVIGSIIEYRRGTATLAVLVLVTAIASNCGEFAYHLYFFGQYVRFGGMSGVVYALFGYAWIKGTYEPEQGIILNPQAVRWMLIWLVICFTGALGSIANAAHVVGLLSGMALGLARL